MTLYWPVVGLCWSIEEAMLPQLLLGLGLVGWGWSVVVCAGGFGVGGLRRSVVGCAFGFGVGGLGLVGRGLCVGLGWSSKEATFEEAMLPQLLLGLGLVGWGWSVVVCAGGFGVGGLRGSVVGCAFGFGVGGLGLVGRGLCWKVWGWSVVVSAGRYGSGWLG